MIGSIMKDASNSWHLAAGIHHDLPSRMRRKNALTRRARTMPRGSQQFQHRCRLT
jgi:hypothetical protein